MKTSILLNVVLAIVIIGLLIKYNLLTEKDTSVRKTTTAESILPETDTNTHKISYGKRTILFPMPALVVGSYDKEGNPNIMTVAWSGICNSNPPSISISIREQTHSYGNIMGQKAFTVNIASENYVREVDYVGTYSGRDENKFESLGLTPLKADSVNAPFVKEFPVNIECKVIKTEKLGLHTQFIGEIMDVKVNANCLDTANNFIIEKIRPIIWGYHHYYGFGEKLGKSFSIGRELKEELTKE